MKPLILGMVLMTIALVFFGMTHLPGMPEVMSNGFNLVAAVLGILGVVITLNEAAKARDGLEKFKREHKL